MNTSLRTCSLGNFCSLAWNVSIGGGNHEFEFLTTSPLWRLEMLESGKVDLINNKELNKRYKEFGNCVIGNDVWIGANATILRGVTVGDGAIIGAGSVVTKDVEPYSIVAGVPAKKLRSRFDSQIVNELLEIKWWDWPIEIIKSNKKMIYESKINLKIINDLRKIKNELK